MHGQRQNISTAISPERTHRPCLYKSTTRASFLASPHQYIAFVSFFFICLSTYDASDRPSVIFMVETVSSLNRRALFCSAGVGGHGLRCWDGGVYWSVFRWHCLETLPLWVWSGKDGKDPPLPDSAPSTEEEWEAEVGEGRLFVFLQGRG